MGLDRLRGRKKFHPKFCFYTTRARKLKKIAKKFKKLKSKCCHYFYPKWFEGGREREKKILVLNSVHTLSPGKKILKKITKKFKKLQNLIPALFLAKTGCDKIGRAHV